MVPVLRRLAKIFGWTLGVLAFIAVGLTAWYQFFYKGPRFSRADPVAPAALQPDAAVTVVREPWIVMKRRTALSRTGLIFYPGGQVAPEGYAEPLRAIAAAGYLVVLVPMPFELAVLASDRATEVMAAFPAIQRWVIAGHSLGGAMAGQYVFRHPGRMAGLMLWDAYLDPGYNLAQATLPVRQLYRTGVDGQMSATYRDTQHFLPPQTEYVPLPGASHMNYGRFIAAERFLNSERTIVEATIAIEVQHARIADASVEFLAAVDAR